MESDVTKYFSNMKQQNIDPSKNTQGRLDELEPSVMKAKVLTRLNNESTNYDDENKDNENNDGDEDEEKDEGGSNTNDQNEVNDDKEAKRSDQDLELNNNYSGVSFIFRYFLLSSIIQLRFQLPFSKLS